MTALVGCVAFFWLARVNYPIIAYGSFLLFGGGTVVVLARYHRRGPETEHALPTLTWAPNQLQIVNVDLSADAVERLARYAARNRRPLPPPAGLIEGSAARLEDVRLLTSAEAEEIVRQDAVSDEAPNTGSAHDA
jgi:hypothetical protein